MGEYIYSISMGRMIKIYYGSFARSYSHLSESALTEQIREPALYHEFTHHMESLAGEKGLELKDEAQLRRYLASKKPTSRSKF